MVVEDGSKPLCRPPRRACSSREIAQGTHDALRLRMARAQRERGAQGRGLP